jgi:hypothetical protein
MTNKWRRINTVPEAPPILEFMNYAVMAQPQRKVRDKVWDALTPFLLSMRMRGYV